MTARALAGAILALLVSAGACTSASSEDVGTPRPLRPLRTPEAPAVPVTPTAAPTPSPTPLSAPSGAEIRAATGVQRGLVNPYCWSAARGEPSECSPGDEGARAPLEVRPGEVVVLAIAAARAPDEESIRAFQGSRSDFPARQVIPALRTDLTLDLHAGEWGLDLCAAWYGHGEPICWVFQLHVRAEETPPPP